MSTDYRTHLVSLVLCVTPALAFGQFGGEGLPDLSGISKAIVKSTASPGVGKSFASGLAVPSVTPGKTAKGIGRLLREKAEEASGAKQPAMQQLEDRMPETLTAIEDGVAKLGFAKRDMGVAVAFFFVTSYETATGKTISTPASVSAGRTIAAAVAKSWGAKYRDLAPDKQESIYENLLVVPTLLNALSTQFDKAGRKDEAAQMRSTAGATFQKLFGVPAQAVSIAADGTISGLASSTTEARRPIGSKPKATNRPADPVLSKGPLTASVDHGAKIFVRYVSRYGMSGMEVRIEQLVLFPDGTAFDEVPDKPLPAFDMATLKKYSRPKDVGRWRISAGKLALTFDGKTESFIKHSSGGWTEPDHKSGSFDVYFPAKLATKAQVLGAWKNENLVTMGMAGGGAPMVAAGSNNSLVLNANGTFQKAGKSFASATTANMGDAFKSGGDVTTTGSGKSGSQGQWRLDGMLLTTVENGFRAVQVAIILPSWGKDSEPPTLLIQGDRWSRPKS